MGADLTLNSLERGLNAPLWGIREAVYRAYSATEIEGDLEPGPEWVRARELLAPIAEYLCETWDPGASFRDPYNETALAAYLGFNYGSYAERREEGNFIPPQAAAKLLDYLGEVGPERLYGPGAESLTDDYWRGYYWGEQADNPSEAMIARNELYPVLSELLGGPIQSPAHAEYQKPEEWLSRWREKYEQLTKLLRLSIERNEPIACSI